MKIDTYAYKIYIHAYILCKGLLFPFYPLNTFELQNGGSIEIDGLKSEDHARIIVLTKIVNTIIFQFLMLCYK